MDAVPARPRDGAARIERALRASAGGLTMQELAAATGRHPNALRRALAKLIAAGSVSAEGERRAGRGRPALRYRLAAAPATYAEDVAVGRRHARSLPVPRASGARGAVRATMTELGFAPRPDDRGGFELARCPLADVVTASAHGRRVCALHHGLLAGVAEAHGGALTAFAIRDPRSAPCRVAVADVPAPAAAAG